MPSPVSGSSAPRPCPLDDEARLQLAEERCVVGERLRELGAQAAFSGRAVGELLESRGGAVDDVVGFRRHFLVGGSSPVRTRQTREAAFLAMIAATAVMAK